MLRVCARILLVAGLIGGLWLIFNSDARDELLRRAVGIGILFESVLGFAFFNVIAESLMRIEKRLVSK